MRIAIGVILLAVLLALTPSSRGLRAESSLPGAADTPADAMQPQADPAWRLIMVEQPGCAYCARWNSEIAPIYPKTPEGKLAPLERVELHETHWREGLFLGPAPVFTPTFLVMQGDREVGRIEGYPGEDFFWGLLGMALNEAGAPLSVSP